MRYGIWPVIVATFKLGVSIVFLVIVGAAVVGLLR